MTTARFPRIARISAAALAIVIPGIILTAGTAGAEPSHGAVPMPQGCSPPVGTILTSKATSRISAWLPTNISSNFVAGPAQIQHTITKTSLTGQTISANFTLDESLLFASAQEQYGLQLQRQHSQAGAWAYTLDVPAGKTLRVQQYHQGWEIGIKQTKMWLRYGKCHVITQISRTGNFFPDRHTGSVDYCWSTTPSKRSPIQVSYTCHNVK